MSATLYSGTQTKVPHVPGSAVTAGDIIPIGNNVYIASVDIAAGENGNVNVGSGTAIYDVTVPSALVIAEGDALYFDGTDVTKTNTDDGLGHAVAAAGNGVTQCLVVHENIKA